MTAPASGEITLRVVSADDWPLWRALRLDALAESPTAFGLTLAQWNSDGDVESRWRERLSSVPHNLIAERRGTGVGMISATMPDPSGMAELISMWVAPASRGTGVGDVLVAAAIDWARAHGARRIELDVLDTNHHAIALYVRHGFIDIGLAVADADSDRVERRMARDAGE